MFIHTLDVVFILIPWVVVGELTAICPSLFSLMGLNNSSIATYVNPNLLPRPFQTQIPSRIPFPVQVLRECCAMIK